MTLQIIEVTQENRKKIRKMLRENGMISATVLFGKQKIVPVYSNQPIPSAALLPNNDELRSLAKHERINCTVLQYSDSRWSYWYSIEDLNKIALKDSDVKNVVAQESDMPSNENAISDVVNEDLQESTTEIPSPDLETKQVESPEKENYGEFATRFITPCSEKQFLSIKNDLELMGYDLSAISCFENLPYLFVSQQKNPDGRLMIVNSSADILCEPDGIKITLNKFNKDLVLALAAMRTGDMIYYGEYFNNLDDCTIGKYGDYYLGEFLHEYLHRKATAEELVNYFTKDNATEFQQKKTGFWQRLCDFFS